MSVLERPLLRPQQRLDLEDWEVLLSGIRTDNNLYTKRFLSETSYIIQGFTISQGFIGQATADIDLAGAVLINGNSSTDFSWWTAPPSIPTVAIPTGSGGLQAGRNYVEIRLTTQEGTPLQRAFWDPTANSGAGIEFTNEVNTVTVTCVEVLVNQVSFTGDVDSLPVAIVDLDGSFNIQGIQDKRELFFRLGEPDDISRDFPWGSQSEPTTVLTFPVPSGTAFTAGETVTFGSGATAEVVVGGTNNIEVFSFSNINYVPGDAVNGSTSGANATLQSYYESFDGADKDIRHYKDMFDALMTEMKRVKGTEYWYEVGNVLSLPALLNYVNALISPISAGAKMTWSGTNLSITDDATSGQATSDVVAAVRLLGYGSDLELTRQDGTGGSASLAIPDGGVLYIEFPTLGSDRTYSESGTGTSNYRVTSRAAFIPTDSNYWVAYREGSKLIVRGSGELQAGESQQIGDETTVQQLAFTGAVDETDSTPPYTTTPNADLSNQFTTADSLTQGISINAANINDIVAGLLKPYQESIDVVIGASGDNQIEAPVSAGTNLTLPLDSRDGNLAKQYVVGSASVNVFMNGIELVYGDDFTHVGTPGALSDEIQILRDLEEGYVIDIQVVVPQFFGTAGVNQPFFVNYITGQNGTQLPVGNLYNTGTSKLQVYRNGLLMNLTSSVGDLIDRYIEANNNSVAVALTAVTSDVFTMVNHTDPSPNVVLQTGQTGTVLTIPTYTQGDGSLRIYRNGALMVENATPTLVTEYDETSTTTITLGVAAQAADVYHVYRSGAAPQWREDLTGVTGTTLTIPNSQTYTNGDARLLVFRNGILMADTTTLGTPVTRYQQNGTTQIDLGIAAVATDFFEFIYVT